MSSFWKKKSFYVILKREHNFSIHGLRDELSTAELSVLLMNRHKSSVLYQVLNTLFTNQSSVRNCHKMTKCELFRTKCCVKIALTLTLATTDVLLINVTRMLQQDGILSVLKNIFFACKMS